MEGCGFEVASAACSFSVCGLAVGGSGLCRALELILVAFDLRE